MPYFSGKVNSIVYHDKKTFYILSMVLDDMGTKITVKGNVIGLPLRIGSWFGFEAGWTTHPKFGKQLSITKAPIFDSVWNPDTAINMLVSHGIGEGVLRNIQFDCQSDADFLSALSDTAKLSGLGCNAYTANHIVERWQYVRSYFSTLDFLSDLGLPSNKIKNIWEKFGEDSKVVLSENPWELVKVDGITFEQADSVAQFLGLSSDIPKRLRGLIIYLTRIQRVSGHLFLSTGNLVESCKFITEDKVFIADTLKALSNSGDVVLDKLDGITAIYDPWLYDLEVSSVSGLKDRLLHAAFDPDDTTDYKKKLCSLGPKTRKLANRKKSTLYAIAESAVSEWGETSGIALSEMQKQGIINGLIEPVSIITGLPGTGKTLSLKAVVRFLQEMNVSFLLCAPTGIAAKNLTKVTGSIAYTIHRAFLASGVPATEEYRETSYAGFLGESDNDFGDSAQNQVWEYNPDNPHPADVIIIDESSMLDQHLIYRLLHCTKKACRIIFVGDAAQLPSVGPGNVLRDLIQSELFPVVSLTEIFRQKDTSDIIYAAHSIHKGEVPDFDSLKDFTLVEVADDNLIPEIMVKLATSMYNRHLNFQMLSPKYSGVVGVTNLNQCLRGVLNPQVGGVQEIRIGNDTIRENDRIMVIRNDYRRGVFNGDVGRVVSIDSKSGITELKIFGSPDLYVKISNAELPYIIRMAYTVTIHKIQGLEYDIIVMPIVDSFRHQLQRNLLYTAVTRAKKKVILLGTRSAVHKSVCNIQENRRNTLFCARLKKV
jgi:exodeoxyribonuclease V alpha subunit